MTLADLRDLEYLVSDKLRTLQLEIDDALGPIRGYFGKYYDLHIHITLFKTIEGHFSLTYEVTKLDAREKITAEASFVRTTDLRTIAKYHLYHLYLQLDSRHRVCAQCGRRHYGSKCPRLSSCSLRADTPECIITSHERNVVQF